MNGLCEDAGYRFRAVGKEQAFAVTGTWPCTIMYALSSAAHENLKTTKANLVLYKRQVATTLH
jgi:hypothetical protein